jgi:hypothetical protein
VSPRPLEVKTEDNADDDRAAMADRSHVETLQTAEQMRREEQKRNPT